MTEKVIFVSNFVGNGGAGRVLSILANRFSESNRVVTICTFSDKKETYPINSNIRNIIINPTSKFLVIKKIKRILRLRNVIKRNPDAKIIAFEYFVNMQTIIAALFLKNKIIVSERNDPAILDQRPFMKIARNLLYRLANVLVCQTPDAKNYFPKDIRKKTVVIPNPLSSRLPDPYSGLRKKEIVNFCRLEPQKNLIMLIDAYHLLQIDYPEYILSIYGDGSEINKLMEYIRKNKLLDKVKIHGFTFDVHSKIYDCTMFASTSDYEGISNSMLEAMAIGLPVVVTDCPCGGARMFIRSYENGILAPVGDTQAFYESMKYIVKNPKEAKRIAENAIKIREELSFDKIYKKWMGVLQSLRN